MRQAQTLALIGEEKESSIFADRTSQYTSEVIDPLFGLFQGVPVGEPVVRIYLVVAQKLVNCPVEYILPRAGGYGDLCTRCSAELRGISGRLNPEFLQGILGNEAVGAPGYAKTGDCASGCL